MVVPLLLTLGLVLLAGSWLVLRTFGEGLRIGRVLAAAPEVTIAEALEMARRGERAYVRVAGRIDADEPFLDEHRRPLVVRRERLEVRDRGGWRVVREDRREVPFTLRAPGGEIEVDAAMLDEGLVVISRESEGRAGEIAERFEPPVDPELPVRFRIDQVSAVEHAYAAGVPVLLPDGTVRIGKGMGRPLIVTTLELDEAMRVLGRGRRRQATLAAALLVGGLACIALALVMAVAPFVLPAAAIGASPPPTPLPTPLPTSLPSAAPTGDTRSSGEGPGLVGQPFVIAFGVILLGLASAGLTVLYARLTRPRP